MFKSLQKETKNNIVFISLLSFFILFYYFSDYIPFISNFLSLFAGILLFFGGFAYGLYSKNPIKSLLFGFLLPSSIVILMFFTDGIEEVMHGSMYTFIISTMGALSGLFAALSSTKTNKGIFYLVIALFFLLIEILYIISGIN